jgi:hypothetical protein
LIVGKIENSSQRAAEENMGIRDQVANHIIEASAPASSKVMIAGSGVALGGGISETTMIAIAGLAITIAGLIWQRFDAKRKARIEDREHKLRMELMEAQLAEARQRIQRQTLRGIA